MILAQKVKLLSLIVLYAELSQKEQIGIERQALLAISQKKRFQINLTTELQAEF